MAFEKVRPNLAPAWAVAHSELVNLIKKHTESMLTRLPETEMERLDKLGKEAIDARTVFLLTLIKRLQAFPESLHYALHPDGTIFIYSTDRYLEKALYFGTRELPRLRPIDFVVSRLTFLLKDHSLVFTARDFRKSHEPDQEFKRENLRQVTPYHA
jgi:hypothetical protein